MTSPLAQPDGRVAVITGAASGFGRELATQCAALGMRLVLADLDLAGLDATRALTGLDDSRALICRCDVADAASVDALATAARLHFGAVHLLFNNAGVIVAGPLWKATPQDWAWVFGVNVMGVAHGIRAFVPDMIARGEPAWVVNTASLAGLVCPAYVDTGIADSQRHRPADLAEVNPDNDDFMARTRTAMKSGRLTATDVARLTLEAVRQERFYVFTHPRAIGGVEQRLRDIVQGHSPTNPLGSAP